LKTPASVDEYMQDNMENVKEEGNCSETAMKNHKSWTWWPFRWNRRKANIM
jgi:hypothetical protein